MPYGTDYDYSANSFGDLRSVHGKLFVQTYVRVNSSSPTNYGLCLMNNGASSYRQFMSESVASGQRRTIPLLSTLIYVDSLGLYLMFQENVVYSSPDGYQWARNPQTGFTGTMGNAVHIPGDGIYVTCGSWVWYAACP